MHPADNVLVVASLVHIEVADDSSNFGVWRAFVTSVWRFQSYNDKLLYSVLETKLRFGIVLGIKLRFVIVRVFI